jgi:hypothetical protein
VRRETKNEMRTNLTSFRTIRCEIIIVIYLLISEKVAGVFVVIDTPAGLLV